MDVKYLFFILNLFKILKIIKYKKFGGKRKQ